MLLHPLAVDVIASSMTSKQALSPQISRIFPHRFMAWQRRGLSARAASVMSLAGCDFVEEITRLGRAYFERRPNCADKTLSELAELAGWAPKRHTAVDAIAAALALAIADPEEAREAAAVVISSLRRSGFVLTTVRREAGA
jgi:hypothetical protein